MPDVIKTLNNATSVVEIRTVLDCKYSLDVNLRPDTRKSPDHSVTLVFLGIWHYMMKTY